MSEKAMCPKFEKAVHLISQRWLGLIVYKLLEGPKRFSELEAAMGISGRVLSERLKDMENEGIVKRDVYPETPVRIEYSLSEKGKSMETLLKEIQNWSHDWIE